MTAASLPARPRILLIDRDREVLRDRLESLRDAGFDAVASTVASEALKTAFDAPPAVVIVDLTSSEVDGFALALELRGDHRTHNLPIIGMISAWSAEVRARAARAGVCVLLLEPCVHDHLLAEVRRALHPARQMAHVAARAINR